MKGGEEKGKKERGDRENERKEDRDRPQISKAAAYSIFKADPAGLHCSNIIRVFGIISAEFSSPKGKNGQQDICKKLKSSTTVDHGCESYKLSALIKLRRKETKKTERTNERD